MTFASDREFYFRAHPGQPHSWGTDHKCNEVVCTVGEWDSARDRFGCSASPEVEIDRLNRELASLLEAVEPLLAAAEKATPGPWSVEETLQWGDIDEYGATVYCPFHRDLVEGATVASAPCEDADECEGHAVIFPRLGDLNGPKHWYPAGEDAGYYVGYDDSAFIATARNTADALRDLLGPTGGEA